MSSPDDQVDDESWKPPRWVYYSKHRPARVDGAEDAKRRSSGKNGTATYLISREQIQELELGTVLGPLDGSPNPNEIRPRKTGHSRHFWLDTQSVIGASRGELTTYIYVLYGISGEVHGYPITAKELKEKGVDL